MLVAVDANATKAREKMCRRTAQRIVSSETATHLLPKQDRIQIFTPVHFVLWDGRSGQKRRAEMNETLSHMTIMVVDDDHDLCDALESTLKATGFRVGTFSSAEEYLGCPDRQSASCLILDVRLPGMSGIELQHVLRETGNTVPIVFLTAHGDATIRETVMKAGALGFLTKPVRRSVLVQQVLTAVALRSG